MNRSSAASGEATPHSATAISLRLRRQFQHRGGDDAERALGADEQLAQAIAGVVLAQPAQAVPDRAVGQHDLQPQHEVAGVAVAHRVVAARVHREDAADLRGAFRADRQRQQAVLFRGGGLCGFQGDAGLDVSVMSTGSRSRMRLSRAVLRISSAAVLVGHRAADHGGVAALRDDGVAEAAQGAPPRKVPASCRGGSRRWCGPGTGAASPRYRQRCPRCRSAGRGRRRRRGCVEQRGGGRCGIGHGRFLSGASFSAGRWRMHPGPTQVFASLALAVNFRWQIANATTAGRRSLPGTS